MVRTPIVQQMERTECGAACLGIVLGYFGRWVGLDQLRIDCGVSRDGSRAGNMVRAADLYGLQTEGHRVPAAETRSLPGPFVAFWGGNHFVVVETASRAHVRINDPAIGRRRLTWAEFERGYAGVVLTFTKGPSFATGGAKPSVMAALAARLRGSGRVLAFVMLASAALAIPGILAPNFTKLFTDYYLQRKYDDWLEPILLAMAGAALIQGFITWMQQTSLLRMEVRIAVSGCAAMMRRLVRLPISFFGQRSPSELAVRATQPESLAQLIGGNLGTAALGLPSIVFFGAVMIMFDPVLASVSIGIALIDMAALALTARTLAERNQAVMIQQTRMTAAGAGGLRMIAEYKSSGSESLLFDRIAGLKARQENLNAGFVKARYALLAVPVAVQGLSMAALLTVGGLRVMSGGITEGVLLAFQALVSSFVGPFSQLVSMGQQLQNARSYATQIDDALHQPESPEFAASPAIPPARSLAQTVGALDMTGLTFGYARLEAPLLRSFDLSIAPGEWLAIVGRSGSGKSTLARLLSGMEHPWSGEVRMDGVPMDSMPRAVLRQALAVVDQSVVIFEGSIRDNIAMWDPTMSDEAIIGAAKLAGIHDFITSRPGGYEAKLTEDGANLSGGQRALIDLARAIAVRPSVLVLDEATAALDAVTEAEVMENLRQLGCTVVVIAHRLSTVRDAGRIVAMDAGRIVESGTHDQLMRQRGLYHDLVTQP